MPELTGVLNRTTTTPRRRRRRGLGILIGLLVLIIAGLVVADVAARAYAENRVSEELAARLPEGSGQVAVTIGGFSFLQQYLAGSFDTVHLAAPQLVVGGVTSDAEITAHGVPLESGQPVREASGSFTIGEDAVNALLAARGLPAGVQLVDGAVQYQGSTEVFGVSVGFSATLRPEVNGDLITLTPTSVEALGSDAPIDVTALLDPADLAIPLCAAELLPVGVHVTGVAISEGELRLDVAASDLPLTAEALSTTGTCDTGG